MINMNGTGEESRKRQKRNSRESKRSNAEREWKGRGVAEGVCTLKKIIPFTGYLHTFFYLFYLATSSSFTVPFLLLRLYSRLFSVSLSLSSLFSFAFGFYRPTSSSLSPTTAFVSRYYVTVPSPLPFSLFLLIFSPLPFFRPPNMHSFPSLFPDIPPPCSSFIYPLLPSPMMT